MSAPREHATLLAKHAVRKMLEVNPSQIETVLAQMFQDVIDASEKDENEACAQVAEAHGLRGGCVDRMRERMSK